jgi:hypothetical protein
MRIPVWAVRARSGVITDLTCVCPSHSIPLPFWLLRFLAFERPGPEGDVSHRRPPAAFIFALPVDSPSTHQHQPQLPLSSHLQVPTLFNHTAAFSITTAAATAALLRLPPGSLPAPSPFLVTGSNLPLHHHVGRGRRGRGRSSDHLQGQDLQ